MNDPAITIEVKVAGVSFRRCGYWAHFAEDGSLGPGCDCDRYDLEPEAGGGLHTDECMFNRGCPKCDGTIWLVRCEHTECHFGVILGDGSYEAHNDCGGYGWVVRKEQSDE